MGKVGVSLVKYDDFSSLQPGTNLRRSVRIVVIARANDHETGQEVMKVEPHMTFGRGLAAAVTFPICGRSDQAQHRAVHDMDRLFEAAIATLPRSTHEPTARRA